MGTRETLNEVLAELSRILGKPLPAEYGPPRAGDILHSLADITLARELLDYEPKVSFENGLKKTVDWYRSNS
jgi:nucleoside-diphosphate-sugar epimerase